MQRHNLSKQAVMRFKRLTHKSYGAFNTMHRVINIGTLSCLTLCCAYASTASAQNVPATSPTMHAEGDKEHLIEAVTVNASRSTTPLSEATRLVSVITAKDIAKTPARSIQELLAYVAGIDISQRGAQGVQADVSIRGGSHEQTLVLINGINMGSSKTGHLSFDLPVNLSDIERIEVLRGPAALIYGAGAFSGAINIITKQQVDTPLYASLMAGMHRLTGLEARTALAAGRTINSLSASRRSSAGYRDNTDFQTYQALWQTRLSLPSDEKIDFQLGLSDKRFGANGFYSLRFPNQYEHVQRITSSLRGQLGNDKLSILPSLYWNREYDRFELIRGTETGLSQHIVNNYGLGLIANYRSLLGTTSLGTELRYEEVIGTKLGTPRAGTHEIYKNHGSRFNSSLSLEHSVRLDHLLISAGALLNLNSLLPSQANVLPSLSINYHPSEHWSFIGSWSRSMRLPTLNDLWYFDPQSRHGENLQPEYSRSWEGAIRYQARSLQAHLGYFHMRGTNLLDWVKFAPTETVFTSHNIAQLTNQGLEAGLTLRLGDYLTLLGKDSKLQLDYLYMHQSHKAPEVAVSRYALNYLRHKFTALLSHRIGSPLELLWAFRFQDRVNQSHPFATLDLKATYDLSAKLRLGLEANNLTGTAYDDIVGLPQPGLWISGSASFRL